MHEHLFIVRDGRGRSVLFTDRDDVVNDDPGVVTTCKDTIDVFGAYVCYMMEASARFLVVKTTR